MMVIIMMMMIIVIIIIIIPTFLCLLYSRHWDRHFIHIFFIEPAPTFL